MRFRCTGPSSAFPRRFLLIVAAAVLVVAAGGCARNVILSNTSHNILFNPNDNGVLVNDANTNKVSYDAYHSTASKVPVGNRSGSGEAVAFTVSRPMAITTPADWAAGDVAVAFKPQISVPVTVWIVQGPFASQKTLALSALTTTNQIWRSEAVGLTTGTITVNDATGNANASKYLSFTCSQQSAMQTAIGQTAGQFNVYFVNQVDRGGGSYGSGNGNACAISGNFVAVGSAIGTELLVHELGHDMSLTHVDDLTTNFDATNVMFSSSSTRQFFTEGQTFRAHMTPTSAINGIFNARSGQPTRTCARDTASNQCPLIQKRIWADGTFPAN